ncbi:hypothetical protein F4859DRAFT_89564 [Xylaria cf. heliscus]|nr:hypothetical protein F4859DRAFT_89564 [Xylaria cf. heliscus]
MAQQRICLRYGVWSGRIANIDIKWNTAGKSKLVEYAKEQGVDPSVLKGVSEHLMYRLAHRIGRKRAIIKSPPHQTTISSTNLNTGRMCDTLCMSGALSSSRAGIQQVRVYLDAKSALTGFEELEVVGEAISIPLGPSRVLTLDLDHSWGVGIEAWTGPTVGGGDQSSSDPSPEPRPGMGADNIPGAGPHPRYIAPTTGRHCMNPEAAEFYPSTAAGREHSTPTPIPTPPQMQTWRYPSLDAGSADAPFADQYPFNMHPEWSPAFLDMLLPMGGYYDTPIDPWVGIPFALDIAPHAWNPYPQGPKYYNYGTQRWEPEWVGFPPLFGYA